MRIEYPIPPSRSVRLFRTWKWPPNKDLGYYWWLLVVDGAALRGTPYVVLRTVLQLLQHTLCACELLPNNIDKKWHASSAVCLTCLHWGMLMQSQGLWNLLGRRENHAVIYISLDLWPLTHTALSNVISLLFRLLSIYHIFNMSCSDCPSDKPSEKASFKSIPDHDESLLQRLSQLVVNYIPAGSALLSSSCCWLPVCSFSRC